MRGCVAASAVPKKKEFSACCGMGPEARPANYAVT